MSDQQPQPAPPQRAEKKELISLITNPQFALCLIEFLKDLPREKLLINDEGNIVEYERQEVLETLLSWTRLNLPHFPAESVKDIPRLEFFNQLTESIFNTLYKTEGSVIPANLREIVEIYNNRQVKKLEGVNPKDLEKLSVKEMVENAVKVQQAIRETADRKLSPEFPEAVQEISEHVFEKTINYYQEQGRPPEAQVLQQIVKDVVDKNPEAGLIFAGKTEEKEPRITASVRRLEPIIQKPQIKQAADTYKVIHDATDLQCNRGNLTAALQGWGLTPSQTLEFLNHLETLPPDISLEEFRKKLGSFMYAKKFTPVQEKQINSQLRSLKRYLELSPNIYHGDNVFLASSEAENRANKWGLSTKVLGAFGLGLSEARIDQELQREDLSEAEKNNLRALKESLREAREKTKIEDVSGYIDKRIKKRGLWQRPEGFYFYRQPPLPPEKPITTFLKGVSKPIRTVAKRSLLRGLGKVKFQRLPGLGKLGQFRPKATIKKKVKFWVGKRVVGGLLIKSGNKLFGKLGKTIIKGGFRKAFVRGTVFVIRRVTEFVAKKIANTLAKRLAVYILGAIITGLVNPIVSAILLAIGTLDFVWSTIKFLKELIAKKPKMLAKGELGIAEATAKILGGPTSLLGLLKGFFRPKTYAEAGGLPLETALSSLSSAAVLAVIGLILVSALIFNPLTPSFIAVYQGYKAYKNLTELVATLETRFGTITQENIDDVVNLLKTIGVAADKIQTLVDGARSWGELQCGTFVNFLTQLKYGITLDLPVAAKDMDLSGSGFTHPTSPNQGNWRIVVKQPENCPVSNPTEEDCKIDARCCGHTFIEERLSNFTCKTYHVNGQTGEVYSKNMPCTDNLEEVWVRS